MRLCTWAGVAVAVSRVSKRASTLKVLFTEAPKVEALKEELRAESRLFVVEESDDASANERLLKVSCH